jgi:hypothetical protein
MLPQVELDTLEFVSLTIVAGGFAIALVGLFQVISHMRDDLKRMSDLPIVYGGLAAAAAGVSLFLLTRPADVLPLPFNVLFAAILFASAARLARGAARWRRLPELSQSPGTFDATSGVRATTPTTMVCYTVTLGDLLDGTSFLLPSAHGLRAIPRTLALAGGVLVVTGVLFINTTQDWFGPAIIALGLLIDLGVACRRPLARLILQGREGGLAVAECNVLVAERGLIVRQGRVTDELAWASLTGVRDDSRMLAIMSAGVAQIGIPRRAFASGEEASAFCALLSARIVSAHS